MGIPTFRGQTREVETAKETKKELPSRGTREDGVSENREEMWPIESTAVERQ